MTDPIQTQSQANPDSGANDPRVDAKSPILAEPRREEVKQPESKQTQGGQQQQQRLDEDKIDGAGREKRESRSSEDSEPAPATSKAKEASSAKAENKPAREEPAASTSKSKEASPSKAESKPAREEPAGSTEVKRSEGSGASSELFMQKTAGDRLPAIPDNAGSKNKDKSQRYQDKYAEVMRDFQAGSLRSTGSHIVREADEAKAIAAEQAQKCDSTADQKDSQAH